MLAVDLSGKVGYLPSRERSYGLSLVIGAGSSRSLYLLGTMACTNVHIRPDAQAPGPRLELNGRRPPT